MERPVTTEELRRLRDEVLDAPSAQSWAPEEMPDGTAQALLHEVATLKEKLRAFLAQNQPPSSLGNQFAVTDPAMQESLLRHISDWYTVRAFHHLLCKGFRQAGEERLAAVVGRAMSDSGSGQVCDYCRAFRQLLQSRTLVFQPQVVDRDSVAGESRPQ